MPGTLKSRPRHEETSDKAREESIRIITWRAEQRQRLKQSMEREEELAFEKMCIAHRRRNQRWSKMTKGNPLSEDLSLWEEKAHAKVQANARTQERRKRLEIEEMQKTAAAVLQRMGNARDDLKELRMEKRILLEEHQRLRSLQDMKKYEARVARQGTPKRNCKTLHDAFFKTGSFQAGGSMGSKSCPTLSSQLPEASQMDSFEFHPQSEEKADPELEEAMQSMRYAKELLEKHSSEDVTEDAEEQGKVEESLLDRRKSRASLAKANARYSKLVASPV